MSPDPSEIIRAHCREMQPLPTDTAAVINPLGDIRAVLFDIYGTLLISGAGDITLQTGTSSDDAFRDALAACGASRDAVSSLSAEMLQNTITEHHAASRSRGIDYPEVDIIAVWNDTLAKIGDAVPEDINLDRLAIEYEVRTNSVWPMPGIRECITRLGQRELPLGIVSNAQDMTPQLFPALLGESLAELGFDPALQFFSYRFGESKPGRTMFEAAVAELQARGIQPQQTVYLGNDMLKDMWAAAQLGFRTILFAGDARSLRLRGNDPRTRDFVPDAIVTDLMSVIDCLAPAD